MSLNQIQSRYKADTELERRHNKGKLLSEFDIKQLVVKRFQGELLTSSLTQFEPLSKAAYLGENAMRTPTLIHRLCTQTFSPP